MVRIEKNPSPIQSHKLQSWFGLSHSSFCVLPRVLLEAMPVEWQDKFAELLEEYDEAFDQSKTGVAGCSVRAIDVNGKLMKMPPEILNYRRPDKEFIRSLAAVSGEYYCQCDNEKCGNSYQICEPGETCNICNKGIMQPQDVEKW